MKLYTIPPYHYHCNDFGPMHQHRAEEDSAGLFDRTQHSILTDVAAISKPPRAGEGHNASVETPGRIKAAPPVDYPPGAFLRYTPRRLVYNPSMDALDQKPCDQWPADEESPDGLRGTPSERFVEAARRVFSATKEQIAEAEAKQQPKPRRRAGRPRTSQV